MGTPKPRINQMAVASLVTAALGVILWALVGGWATLIAATIAIASGYFAIARINRTGERGRWPAIAGISFGVLFYGCLIVVVVWDFVSPIKMDG